MSTSPAKPFDIATAGQTLHQWASDLWPLNRSLTGQGVRDTLAYLQRLLPDLTQHAIATGSQVFDWQIPQEWHCEDAYIITPSGQKICQFKMHNLHVIGYSEPVNKTVSLAELKAHLHTLPNRPDAIPYVTSYYQRNWGFCLTHRQYLTLEPGDYQVVIDSKLFDGVLNFADVVIKGQTEQEILLSTNICHPSMANNELSGLVMVAGLAKWLSEQANLHYTYRLLFLPETIGAITYLSQHKDYLIDNVVGGYQIICCGDERAYSINASPYGDNISDTIAIECLKQRGQFDRYSFLSRGSDERQYCAPHIRLPIASICRSKYAIYPEYHNSDDDLIHVVTAKGLQQTFELLHDCIQAFETQRPSNTRSQCLTKHPVKPGNPQIQVFCEPQLGKRGLYDSLADGNHPLYGITSRMVINVITYCDGANSVEQIATLIGLSQQQVIAIIDQLETQGLIGWGY